MVYLRESCKDSAWPPAAPVLRSFGRRTHAVGLVLVVALALGPVPVAAEWSIGIYAGAGPFALGPIEGQHTPVLTGADVPAFPTYFVADPFLARSGDTWFLFFEALNNQNGQGDIAYATSADGLTWTWGGVALDESFHLGIVAATQNPVFVQIVHAFYRLSRLRREAYFSDLARCRQSFREHEAILREIIARDCAAAQRLMHRHIEGGLRRAVLATSTR